MGSKRIVVSFDTHLLDGFSTTSVAAFEMSLHLVRFCLLCLLYLKEKKKKEKEKLDSSCFFFF